ncbi:MAG: glycosyltransferase family 2 protein [Candidatus Shapirobacteria bacterium]|nr:glycosyltransferase family 2 protein [Candidatus Shapirobacteria bacterium]
MTKKTNKIDLSIIIVTYNNCEATLKTIHSYQKAIDKDKSNSYELIISDNSPREDVVQQIKQKYPGIKIIHNKSNLGFSKANNVGFEKSRGKYLLFSNPDIEVQKNTLPYLLSRMKNSVNVGACTPFLRLALNNDIDWGAHRGFPTPWASFSYYSGLLRLSKKFNMLKKQLGKYYLLDCDLNKEHEVDAIRGGFFFIKKDVFIKAGRWDESYFMYGEDIDLSYQIKKVGYKIMFFPQVEALHYHGLTTGLKKHSSQLSLIEKKAKMKAYHAFYDSMKIFYDKNYKNRYSKIARFLVITGIELKRLLGLLSKKV